MNLVGCVPLAGLGLIARRGNLTALTDGASPGPDALLAALDTVADANGDGAALVLAGTRAALERGGRPTWACAGVTFAGEVAVLVHGHAVALVRVNDGPATEVTDNGSMVPVVRTFTGAVVTVQLSIGAPAEPDPRLWLGIGTVYGGGVFLTVADEASQEAPPAEHRLSAVPSPLPELDPEAEETVLRHGRAGHASQLPPDPVPVHPGPAHPGPAHPSPVPEYEPTMLAGAAAAPLASPSANGLGWPGEQAAFPDDPFMSLAGLPEPAQATPDSESWFRAGVRQASGPTLRLMQTGPGVTGALPEPPITDLSAIELVQLGAVEPVLVDGAMCPRMHFNAPEAVSCRECGLGMSDDARATTQRQPRPPLGVLLVDDGRGFTLDRDYVIGREPVLDGDVAAGRAAPLRITDPKGTVSRLHLRVSLVGWRVEVCDLGSSNGSVLYRPGGSRPLAPLDATVLDPGGRVGVGRRTVQYLPYSAPPLGTTL